jgi:hypothetical protein
MTGFETLAIHAGQEPDPTTGAVGVARLELLLGAPELHRDRDEPGLRARNEIGGYLKWAWTTPVVENVTYAVRMDLFSNFLKDPQNVDVFMDHLLTLKVNSILTTTVSATLLYDHDVQLQKSDPVLNPDGTVLTPARTGPGVQFREVLSVGLSLKL